jgi:hypothetical protein
MLYYITPDNRREGFFILRKINKVPFCVKNVSVDVFIDRFHSKLSIPDYNEALSEASVIVGLVNGELVEGPPDYDFKLNRKLLKMKDGLVGCGSKFENCPLRYVTKDYAEKIVGLDVEEGTAIWYQQLVYREHFPELDVDLPERNNEYIAEIGQTVVGWMTLIEKFSFENRDSRLMHIRKYLLDSGELLVYNGAEPQELCFGERVFNSAKVVKHELRHNIKHTRIEDLIIVNPEDYDLEYEDDE